MMLGGLGGLSPGRGWTRPGWVKSRKFRLKRAGGEWSGVKCVGSGGGGYWGGWWGHWGYWEGVFEVLGTLRGALTLECHWGHEGVIWVTRGVTGMTLGCHKGHGGVIWVTGRVTGVTGMTMGCHWGCWGHSGGQ